MKKILFLCSRVPYPLLAGDKIRMFNSLKLLSEEYSVDLLYIDVEYPKESVNVLLRKYCNEIYCFKMSKLSHYVQTLIGFFTNKKPLQVNYYYNKKVQKWIDNNIDNYDMVYCNNIRTTEYVRKYNTCKIVDFVDSIAMNYIKAYKKSFGIWKLIYKIEKERVKSYEKEIAIEFQKKIIISSVDRRFIDPDNLYNIKVIGNFVSEIIYNHSLEEKSYQLSFLGKMNYEPNISATIYFAKEIFPILKRHNSNISFKIIGAFPVKKIIKLQSIKDIEVMGFMKNPYDEIQKSQLFIAPMVSGAGIQNKILEAMKIGKCVITTTIGAEGLECLKGNELIIADTKEDIIKKIIFYLDHKKNRDEIGRNAQRYIQRYFSKERIGSSFLEFIRL